MKNITILIQSLALVAALASCASESPSKGNLLLAAPAEKGTRSLDESEKGAVEAFLNAAIDRVAGQEEGNHVFSPLSYYLALASTTALAKEDVQACTALGAKSKDQLTELVSALVADAEVVPEQYQEGWTPVSIIGNLVLDRTIHFSEQEQVLLTDKLHASYGSNPALDEESIARWVEHLSMGALAVPDSLKGLDATMDYFINGVYLDMPFAEPFYPEGDQFGAFNGEGRHRYYRRDLTPSYCYIGDDYVALELRFATEGFGLRFVMPKENSVREFLKRHPFSSCFESAKDHLLVGKGTVAIPEFNLASNMELSAIAHAQNLPDSYLFGSSSVRHDILSLTQDNAFFLQREGVRAYSFTKEVVLEQSAPSYELSIDHSFAFEVVSPSKFPLFHGVVETLE